MTAPHLGPGHTIAGRYTVRALLGFTGEVATYQAMDQEGHEVVVKLYDPAIGQRADVMSQLERVHGLLSAMQPELVVPVLDAGYDSGSGAPFTVSDRLNVMSLAKLVESGPPSTAVVARVIRGLGQVLDAAAAVGLCHHALKPTNVFVGPGPDYPVRVTDFGSSVVRSASPTHEAYARAAPWWAPEQLQPGSVLGPATDVFTSALIAFYALTGKSYWKSCQASPPDLSAWQAEVMGERALVSDRARQLGGDIPPPADGAFSRALSVNQVDRPTSAIDLAQALTLVQSYGVAAKTLALPEMDYPRGAAFSAADPPQVGQSGDGYAAVARSATPGPSEAGSGPTPGLPPFRRSQKKQTSSMVPVIIGVTGAVVLGGVGMVFLFTRTTHNGATSPAGSADSAVPISSQAHEDDDPATSPSTSASTDSSASAGGAASSEAEVEVTIQCVPTCDELYVDSRAIEKPDRAFRLIPGRHVVKAMKSGYVTLIDTVDIAAGKPFQKEYRLVKSGGPITPKKDCGQFLKPCK